MAYEGFFYWKDWEEYLGVVDDAGIAKYMNCGTLLLESATGHHEKVLKHYRDIGVEYEEWDTKKLRERMPIFDTHAFYPPKRPEDPQLLGELRGGAAGRDLHARARATSTTPSWPRTTSSGRPRPRAASSCSARRSPRSGATTAA